MYYRIAPRLAGAMFLVVMAAVLAASTLGGESAGTITDRLHAVANDPAGARASVVALLFAAIATMVLGIALYTVSKGRHRDLALLAFACRVVEAALYSFQILGAMVLLSLGGAPSPAEEAVGAVVADVASWSINIGATFFAVGSAVFSFLLLGGRMIPVPIAVLGLVASLVLVVAVPLEAAAGVTTAQGSSMLLWLPMFVFEIVGGLWLLIKGARVPVAGQSAAPIPE